MALPTQANQAAQATNGLATSGNGKRLSRVHIKKDIPQLNVQVNIFGDDPEEAFNLYLQTSALMVADPVQPSPPKPSRAHIDRLSHEAQARQAQKQAGIVNTPVCQECGTDESMELIEWQDKSTGEARRAWKCQGCGKWAPRKK